MAAAYSESEDKLEIVVTDEEPNVHVGISDEDTETKAAAAYGEDLKSRRIKKVLPTVREDPRNDGLFDPQVVSIGPYHHGKMNSGAAEKMKPTVARIFITSQSSKYSADNTNTVRDYLNRVNGDNADDRTWCRKSTVYQHIHQRVKEKVGYARSCYDEGSTEEYSDDEFTEMMILDGFFVLAMLQCFPRDHIGFYKFGVSSLGRNGLVCALSDVFLIDNQLPFQILGMLMGMDTGLVWELLASYFNSRLPGKMSAFIYGSRLTASHIRDRHPIHLLELLWICVHVIRQRPKMARGPSDNLEDALHSFSHVAESVTELKAMGIRFTPNQSHMPTFKFKSHFLYGSLELPPFLVSEYSTRHIANMVAFEMESSKFNLPEIAAINFWKSLINHPDDVRELRSRRILFASGMNDDKVVEIVNQMATFGIDDPSFHLRVRKEMYEHISRKSKTWMAELIHNYCRSPWTAIGFVAATCLLVLTFTQTYFTVFPRS